MLYFKHLRQACGDDSVPKRLCVRESPKHSSNAALLIPSSSPSPSEPPTPSGFRFSPRAQRGPSRVPVPSSSLPLALLPPPPLLVVPLITPPLCAEEDQSRLPFSLLQNEYVESHIKAILSIILEYGTSLHAFFAKEVLPSVNARSFKFVQQAFAHMRFKLRCMEHYGETHRSTNYISVRISKTLLAPSAQFALRGTLAHEMASAVCCYARCLDPSLASLTPASPSKGYQNRCSWQVEIGLLLQERVLGGVLAFESGECKVLVVCGGLEEVMTAPPEGAYLALGLEPPKESGCSDSTKAEK